MFNPDGIIRRQNKKVVGVGDGGNCAKGPSPFGSVLMRVDQ